MEAIPRIWMRELPPGLPSLLTICTPADIPCRASTKPVPEIFSSCSALTTEADPVKLDFFEVPYATTMVSSRASLSSARVITIPLAASATRVLYPTQDTTTDAPVGTFLSVKVPSGAVMTPLLVPCTTTPAPMIPSPAASFTVPEMVLYVWAERTTDIHANMSMRHARMTMFLFISNSCLVNKIKKY